MKFTGQKQKMKLIMFAGIPGTGKSTLSEAIGRALNTPVFAAHTATTATWAIRYSRYSGSYDCHSETLAGTGASTRCMVRLLIRFS